MVQFSFARSPPTKLGHPSGKVFWSHICGEQVRWGRIFNRFWQSASSSTLWYSFLWLARLQPRSATPPARFFVPIFEGEQVPWGRIFNIFWQSASSSTLWYSLLWLVASNPAQAPLREGFLIPYLRESKSLWAEFLTYSEWARRVLPYGTVYFGSLASNSARPHFGNVLIPYLRRQQVTWGRIFNIFWESTSSSTLWYNLLWPARCQSRSAPPPRMFWSHIYGDSKSLGAEFLTYSVRACPVLPYGTIYFGSRASNPARPPLRECFDPIFTGTASPLGPNF